jgi:hypothetical protein
MTPEWLDEGLLHRVTISFVVPTGPGVEIVAAELLLDVVQRFDHQGIGPSSLRLEITSTLSD